MKKNLLKVALPLIIMGSPAFALSSVRSGSRNKIKKTVVQSKKSFDTTLENEASFNNPFGGFGGTQTTVTNNVTQPGVLAFLAEEGLLSASGEVDTIVSGNTRKEFLAQTQCVAGATYNGKNLFAVFTTTTSTSFYLLYGVSTTTSTTTVTPVVFANAKAACLQQPLPTTIPTLSQWGQYLLILLLGLFGTRRFSSLKSKIK